MSARPWPIEDCDVAIARSRPASLNDAWERQQAEGADYIESRLGAAFSIARASKGATTRSIRRGRGTFVEHLRLTPRKQN